MDWKLIGMIGLKVLLAAGAGLAVFVGIEKAGKVSNNDGTQQPKQTNENCGGIQCCNNSQPELLMGLHAAQDTCGKVLAFVQSLTMIVENVVRIFGKNEPSQPYCSQTWMYNSYPGQSTMVGFRRINPFIQEAIPAGGYGTTQSYFG